MLSCIAIVLFYKGEIIWPKFGLFFLTQSTFLQFWTPEFLRGYGCGTPNGSLWTMCVIIQFYIAIWLFRKWFKGKNYGFWITTLVLSVAIASASMRLDRILPEILYKLYGQTLIPYAWMFLLGMLLADKQNALLPILKKRWYVCLAACVLIRFLPWEIGISYFSALDSIALGVFCIGFAYAFPGLSIKTDISYALYIYHMIVVNAMIAFGCTETLTAFLIACVASTALAILSTKYIAVPIQRRANQIRMPISDSVV